jgi:flagellin-like protein
MSNRRVGLPTYKPVDVRGVSEVVGTVLLLAMTVVVFSGIILFVNSLTGPGNQTYVDLVPSLQRTDPNNGIVTITHAGGQPLQASTTTIIIQSNGTAFPLAVTDGLVPSSGNWVTGQRWTVPFTGNQLSQNATIQVTVIDGKNNQVVLLAVVQRGIGNGGAFPIIGTAAVIPDGYVYNSGLHNFGIRVVAVDYDNDLPSTGVRADLGVLGCGLANQTLADTGFGVFETQTWSNISSCLPAGTYSVNLTATDLAGHATRGFLMLQVRSLAPAQGPVITGQGPFGWTFNNRFQAFEIYNSTEWDSKRYNGTGTRDFVKGETVVIVVASQFLKNIDLQDDVMLFSPSGLPVKALVYGGGSPTATSHPSSTRGFGFEEFIGGYFIYSARFNTNSAAYGFNGSQLAAGPYSLDMTLRTSNIPPPDNRFETTAAINITDASGIFPNYPRLEFYKDKDLTQPSNTFNFTEFMYVKITVATTSDDAVIGAVTIGDYQGGIQIFAPPGNTPVYDYSIRNSTVYTFVVDLSSPNRDPWVFGTNAYGVTINQLYDVDEKYALSGQLIIRGPLWAADVISAMHEFRPSRFLDREYSVFYENGANNAKWDETPVAAYSTSNNFSPRWAGRDMLDVVFADMDGDGSLDAVMGSSSGFVLLFRNVDGIGHSWDSNIIDNFGGPDAISVAAGHIDADQFNDVVAGNDNGQIWYYKNDGSWVPLICDRTGGRRICTAPSGQASSPVLIANVGAGVRVQDLKIADMNGDGANDVVAGLSNNAIKIFYGDGFGGFGTTSNTDYTMASDSAVQGTLTNTYTATQTTNNVYEQIKEVNGTGQTVITYGPVGEFAPLYGQIETGSFANTFVLDGAPYEVLSETYGNNKWMIRNSTAGSAPGLLYSFSTIPTLGGSDTATVTISGFLSTGSEPMEIHYKVGNGAVSSTLGTISETSLTTKTFALTGFTGGDLYIDVQDSDITNNDGASDAKQTKISVDYLAVNVIKANGTTSRLEHKWQTAAIGTGGAAYRFFVEANHTLNNETDDFLFEWGPSSTGPWSTLLTVTKTTDDNSYQSVLLPASVGGSQIYIRATDLNRAANATALDTLYVDHMFVRRYTSTPNTLSISTGGNVAEFSIGDMNGDGRNDIAAVVGPAGKIYYGQNFTTSTSLATPATAYSIDIGDIDGDGKLDVVMGENSQFVHVFYNANGTFPRTQFVDLSPVRNSRANYLRVGDIDGDGHDDIIIATNDGAVLYYRHLQGAGWTFEFIDTGNRQIHTVDIGDADRGVSFSHVVGFV